MLNGALDFSSYPLGPNLSRLLGIKATQPGASKTNDEWRQFESYLTDHLSKQYNFTDVDSFASVLEELVLTKLPLAALSFAESGPLVTMRADFRCCLAIGSAALMAGEFHLAEEYFRLAQRLVPEEIAPYTNVCELLFRGKRDEECLEWALGALKVDANVFRIWEVIGGIYFERHGANTGESLRQLADEHSSWAGRLLATQYLSPNDAMLQAETLEDFYHQGVRAEEFLLELTAALGASLQYQKIPAIIWEAERRITSGSLCWQLYAHAAQAFFAMNQYASARMAVNKALKQDIFSEDARNELINLTKEIDQAEQESVITQ